MHSAFCIIKKNSLLALSFPEELVPTFLHIVYFEAINVVSTTAHFLNQLNRIDLAVKVHFSIASIEHRRSKISCQPALQKTLEPADFEKFITCKVGKEECLFLSGGKSKGGV